MRRSSQSCSFGDALLPHVVVISFVGISPCLVYSLVILMLWLLLVTVVVD